jgi:hypothetical protein
MGLCLFVLVWVAVSSMYTVCVSGAGAGSLESVTQLIPLVVLRAACF